MTDYHVAHAIGKNLDISNKQAREILKFVTGMNVDKAIKRLERVLNKEEAVPYKRFHRKVGHKKGSMGPGRYPEKASIAIINTLKSAKNNALNKGLQEEKLIIKEGVVMMDVSKMGRIRTRKGGYTGSLKSTSVKVILTEAEVKEDKKTKKEEVKPIETKPVEKKKTPTKKPAEKKAKAESSKSEVKKK